MANTKYNVILEIRFLKLNNANMLFRKKLFLQKFYITNKALPTIKQV